MHLGAALGCFLYEVERLIGCEAFTGYQVQTNSESFSTLTGSVLQLVLPNLQPDQG